MSITEFLSMGGYGYYVFSAYGLVLTCLFWQWLLPWKKWRKYQRLKNDKNE